MLCIVTLVIIEINLVKVIRQYIDIYGGEINECKKCLLIPYFVSCFINSM